MVPPLSEHIDDAESIPELTFDMGVAETIARIDQLLQQQDCVVIAINFTGENVGKSFFTRRILKILHQTEIPALYLRDRPREMDIEALNLQENRYGSKKMILILEEAQLGSLHVDSAMAIKRFRNDEAVRFCRELGHEHHGIDFWVGLHTPSQPFSQDHSYAPIADFIIRNEEAKIKKNF